MPSPTDLGGAAVDLTARLVAIDSVSPSLVPSAEGEGRIASVLAERLGAAGYAVELIPAPADPRRVSVLAQRTGSRPGRTVVLNGHLDREGMAKVGLANDEIFADLRQREITQLGEVRLAYAEANGDLSLFRYDPPDVRPGLAIVPPPELEPPPDEDEYRRAGLYACRNCGRTRELPEGPGVIRCECEVSRWVPAVLPGAGVVSGD